MHPLAKKGASCMICTSRMPVLPSQYVWSGIGSGRLFHVLLRIYQEGSQSAVGQRMLQQSHDGT